MSIASQKQSPNGQATNLPWCKDLANLRESGLSDQTIRENGLYTEQDPEKLRQMLNRPTTDSQACLGGLVIPYLNLDGMVAFACASNSASGVRNMVALARSEPGVPIDIEELDRDPFLMNVENGTIDLHTGRLRGHRREDLLTKLAPVVFDSGAHCPVWLKFLQTVFAANGDLIGYLQRLVGYCLTGATEEHILPFLYGVGANGKSTFCELVLRLLGWDYAMKAPPDLLMAKRGESHPTERADLFGKRFVACVETEDGRRMAEALVKELTGGDRVRARRMREDFWEFTPTHHVWLVGNYKPTITGTDHGIWRRIKLIPFDVVIPETKQDKKLLGKLVAELPGILNWAIEGCLNWQQYSGPRKLDHWLR